MHGLIKMKKKIKLKNKGLKDSNSIIYIYISKTFLVEKYHLKLYG